MAFFCWSSSPTIKNCIFRNNTGGTFRCYYSNMRLENCVFESNATQVDRVVTCLSGAPSFVNCTFRNNGATTLYLDWSYVTLEGCLFYGNTAPTGGNIWCHGGMPQLVNCTVSGNTATGRAALFLDQESVVRMYNTIVWNNQPANVLLLPGEPNQLLATYSDIQGGWTGTGNLNASPLFVNAAGGDFRLAVGSPCIDAGDSDELPPELILDLASQPRLVDAPCVPDTGHGASPLVDIGAFEFQTSVAPGDLNCDGAVNAQDLVLLAQCLGGPDVATYPGCSAMNHANADLEDDGDVDLADYALLQIAAGT